MVSSTIRYWYRAALVAVLLALAICVTPHAAWTDPKEKEIDKKIEALIQVLKANPTAESYREVRKAIAELAAIGEPAVPKLIRVFADPKARTFEYRFAVPQAIDALAAIGKPAVPKLVDAILEDDDLKTGLPVSAYSAGALDKIGKEAVGPVRTKWKDLSEADKWKLMPFLGKYDYEGVLDFVLGCVESKDRDVRIKSITYLGQHKETKAKAAVLEALKHDPKLLGHVLYAMIGIDRELAIDLFIQQLAPVSPYAKVENWPGEGNQPPWAPDLRSQIIETLGRMKAKRSAPALLKVLQEKGAGKAYLGEFIIPLLGEFGYTEAVAELRRVLATDEAELARSLRGAPAIHLMAARALWQLNDRLGRLFLLQGTTSRDATIKRWSAQAVARYGDAADIWVLAECLESKDWETCAAGCQGLERITGEVKRGPPGFLAASEHDAPLWREWYQQRRRDLFQAKPARATAPPDPAKRGAPASTDLEDSWKDLGSSEAGRGHRAMFHLVSKPRETVALISEHLPPVPWADEKQIARWIAALRSDRFAERDEAAKQLELAREFAEPALRQALAANPPPDVRRRLEALLAKCDAPVTAPETLRSLRAIAVLEEIKKADAVAALQRLANGAPVAIQTQEAKAAVARLAGRSTKAP